MLLALLVFQDACMYGRTIASSKVAHVISGGGFVLFLQAENLTEDQIAGTCTNTDFSHSYLKQKTKKKSFFNTQFLCSVGKYDFWGIKLEYLCIRMKPIKNKKYLQQKFHERWATTYFFLRCRKRLVLFTCKFPMVMHFVPILHIIIFIVFFFITTKQIWNSVKC